ncbi:YiiX/YebB-like N1pC/P60 family cysteine hydrolase [Bacteroides oleiciplenus]|uniref:Permuted papain-like amidase enzyme, YaeF/YiiX, C92 family n=2 Tax=Bacteroides oleiciplenus TaxID=626931 RepID=K9ES49_9BACE|nr:YiiX/YebB-like N1pC/P60 family cysteine hydrolase [Bacteroides oleiciplenus]EKU92025.1 hypothetical protein HMPREF9447_01011 [Bacteroides oleiciplenus YIT 12058]RGN33919.1 hypothetical protein DXB65_15720 [Bacteroides oleiciplenus]
MERKTQVSILKIMLILALTLAGCQASSDKETPSAQLPQALLRDGDIAFRRGTGIASRVVLAADREGSYSHTGILKKKKGQWYVIHAVPGEPDFKDDPDRVKMEPIETFFKKRKVVNGAIMRVQEDSIAACRAAIHAERLYDAHVLFDHDYDLADTTKMYCTEFIDFVYKKEGIDLPEGRISHVNIPGFRGDYLLPNDIAQSKRLCLIYYF